MARLTVAIGRPAPNLAVVRARRLLGARSKGAPALLALWLLAPTVARAQAEPHEPTSATASTAESSPPVAVEITPSATRVTVGETFTLELKASGPPGTTYTFPGGASDDTVEIRTPAADAGEEGASSAPAPGTHRYEAELFTLGEVQLPPIPVRYRLPDGTEGEVATAPLRLEVVSMLPKDADEQKLADIRGPEAVSIGPAFWVALVGGLVVVAALVWWINRRRRREVAVPTVVVPEVPPDVEALRALDELERAGFLEGGALRTFYIHLAAIAKRYLERRLGAPVLEMTSAETLSLLRRHAHGGDLLPVMRDLAEAADRIKFARGQGVVAEAERHLGSVRAMVPALEARLAPPPAETGEAA